jgi:hypothetical protein
MPPSVSSRKPHRLDRVVRQNDEKQKRQVKKIAMNVLKDQWEFALATIAMPWFADCASRRIGPKRLIIGAAVIITSEAKSARRPKN